MCVLRVRSDEEAKQVEVSVNENDPVAMALGVKEVKRNSLEIVEAAFDNELDTIKKLLDKGYHIESEDGHGHSALSEASCQGHDDIVAFLLEQGADPNKLSDQGKSPLYRAAYNGHLETVQLLIKNGADPRLVSKQG
jgi:ankyrin repeat protein